MEYEQLRKEIEYLKEIIKAKDELITELRQQVRYPVYIPYVWPTSREYQQIEVTW